MPTTIKYVPIGLVNDDNTNLIHETLEDYLFNKWSDTDPIPRNQIRFSYKMDQNVSTNARNSIKTFDFGSNLNPETGNTTNDSMKQEITTVQIVVETRSINNLQNDVPIELYKIKKQIRDIIQGDRTGLRPSGIHLMTLLSNETIERDVSNNYIYRMKLYVECRQFMEKRVIVTP